jgi:hypothetical protein
LREKKEIRRSKRICRERVEGSVQHQAVSALSPIAVEGIEPWISLPSLTSITFYIIKKT